MSPICRLDQVSSSTGTISAVNVCEPRMTRASSGRPIDSATIRRCSSPTSDIERPSTSTIKSSGRRPARAAGLPSTTSTTSTADPPPSDANRGGRGLAPPTIPMNALRTRPSPISCATMRRVAALIGTARPRPTPATAVLIPTTRPRPSASAPPELPGFSAASVWMTLSTKRVAAPERVGSDRPSAETTPAVTEPLNPCGFPIATTSWPTRRFSASPSIAGCTAPSARSTARSERGSLPTICTVSSRPSVNEARTFRDRWTTCADVSRNPSGVIATALPPPPRARRLATDGLSRSTTRITACEYASSASSSGSCSDTNVRSTPRDGSSHAKVCAVLEIRTIDYHTGGEPSRIVQDQPLHGTTILEKRRDAAGRLDHLRRLLVNEPRGHADMYGCFVTEPEDDGADLGVVFFHNAGYSTACGHGTIALVTWALESGVVPVAGEETHVVVDVPSGRLETVARVRDGDVVSVRFRNVPSFVWETGVAAAGREVDVAFGGAFYASLEERVDPRELPRLIALGRELKHE